MKLYPALRNIIISETQPLLSTLVDILQENIGNLINLERYQHFVLTIDDSDTLTSNFCQFTLNALITFSDKLVSDEVYNKISILINNLLSSDTEKGIFILGVLHPFLLKSAAYNPEIFLNHILQIITSNKPSTLYDMASRVLKIITTHG